MSTDRLKPVPRGWVCPFHWPSGAVRGRVLPQEGLRSGGRSWAYLLFLSCIINSYTSGNLEGLVGPWVVLQFLAQMGFYVSHSQSCFLSVLTVQIPCSCSSPGLAIPPWVCRHTLTRWHLLGRCFAWVPLKTCDVILRAAVFKQLF